MVLQLVKRVVRPQPLGEVPLVHNGLRGVDILLVEGRHATIRVTLQSVHSDLERLT